MSLCSFRNFATATPYPRIIGVGEEKSSTPISPPTLPWYKQPGSLRTLVNIWLLAFFANCAVMILGYKSEKREITWQSKERIQALKETISKVRNSEPIDVRAALGTGDRELESQWANGTLMLSGWWTS